MSESEIKEAKQFLKRNSSLLLLKSDERSTTVIAERDFYTSEILNMLNVTNTYTISKFEYTCTFEKRANFIISNTIKKKQTDEQVGKRFKTFNSIVPRVYALP